MDNTTYSAVLDVVAETMKGKKPAADGVRRILDLFMNLRPHPVWEEIAACDVNLDVENLKTWLHDVLTRHPPDGRIVAFHFGLFEGTVDEGSEGDEPVDVRTILYICGSDRYGRDDPDWACSPAYFPEGRYANSSVLRCVYRKTSGIGGPVLTLGTDCFCLSYAVLAAAQLMREMDSKVLLGRKKQRFVGAGHDGGETYTIGKIAKRGFSPNRPHAAR